jgi:hypothetical protein
LPNCAAIPALSPAHGCRRKKLTPSQNNEPPISEETPDGFDQPAIQNNRLQRLFG